MFPKNYKKITALGNITTPFGGKTRNEPVHPGVDIANVEGTPIPALESGVVTGVKKTTNGFGNVVIIKDIHGKFHQYGHLLDAMVKIGQNVRKGQTIGRMGKTGNSYSPSGGDPTHLDIRIADARGGWTDPTPMLRNLNK